MTKGACSIRLALGLALLALNPGNAARGDIAVEKLRGAAPDLTFSDASHRFHRLSEYRGKKVVLHFWASWCKPCLKELPELEKIKIAGEGENLVFIPVSIDEPAKEAEALQFFSPLVGKVDFFIAQAGKPRDQFLTWGLPVTYFIDAEGSLKFRALGPRNWSGEPDFKKFLRKVFSK
jgi:thiol-disulfide isomerase/thioredoxin